MAGKKVLIVANWKMYPKSLQGARKLLNELGRISKKSHVEVALAPPFPYLWEVARHKKFSLAAQDVFWESEGAFTGEVAPPMLKDLGVRYVIIGHSERRRLLGETDEMVNKKLKAVLGTGLRPIICIGEYKRDADGSFFSFLKDQVSKALSKVKKDYVSRILFVYEPVWAISPGKPALPGDAREAALFIRKTIAGLYGINIGKKVRILYGGSVDGRNAESFLRESDISGLLVGKESRDAEEFLKIVQCANHISQTYRKI